MKYQVTARKWRPRLFGEVIGQEHVTRALRNALTSGKISQAYLFSGPRGVGKTTTARILAKALNYPGGPNPDPVNDYELGDDIMRGQALDVREIDGASNRGIENIREIRENVVFKPLSATYKIYIIDEVHMLTTEASNALLKTLEEPPEHVIFIMATTESHKVLPTIRSRTQHYVFKRIPNKVIVDQLKAIAQAESIQAEEKALYVIANAAEGSMRDAQSLFDQVVLFSEGKLSLSSAEQVLGIPDTSIMRDLVQAMISTDIVGILSSVKTYLENIGDFKLLVRSAIEYLRNALLVKKLPQGHELVDLSQDIYQDMKVQFEDINEAVIIQILNHFVEVFPRMKGDADERFLLETTLYRAMDSFSPSVSSAAPVKKAEPVVSSSKAESVQETPPAGVPAPQAQESTGPTMEPLPAGGTPLNPAQIKEAFFQVLAGNPLTRHYSSHIQNFSRKGRTINVFVNQAHIAELLSTNKQKITAEVCKLTHSDLQFEFIFNKDQEAQTEAQAQAAVPEPVQADPEPAKSENITDTIINLFDGKIQD